MNSSSDLAEGLKAVSRAAKAANAHLSKLADEIREMELAVRAMRAPEKVPPSWEVERHAFIVRMEREL